MANGNGNGKLYFWLLSIAVGVLISLAGAWTLEVRGDVDELQEAHERLFPLVEALSVRVDGLKERIQALEAEERRLRYGRESRTSRSQPSEDKELHPLLGR